MHELRILAGHPTDEELAAVTVVLMAAATRAQEPDGGTPAGQSRWRLSARPLAGGRPGQGAWRASALPAR